jgi:flagellin-like protein
MMTIMGKRFTNRGISTIIAALLLIAIAIAAGVLLYVFSMGLIGSLQGTGGQQTKDQIVMEAYQWPSGSTLTLDLRNTGATTINLGAADFYVAGNLIPTGSVAISGCTASTAVNPGTACTVVLSGLTAASYYSGVAYVIKIGLTDGGVMSYSAVDGMSQ